MPPRSRFQRVLLLCLLAAEVCSSRRRVEEARVGSSMVTRGRGTTANLG